jgi:hypothetical protein
MWTVAMIHADLAAIRTQSRYARDAAKDLATRMDDP